MWPYHTHSHANLYCIIPEIIDYTTLIGTRSTQANSNIFIPAILHTVLYGILWLYMEHICSDTSLTWSLYDIFILSSRFFFLCAPTSFLHQKIPHYLCTFNILLIHYFATQCLVCVDIENFAFFSISLFCVFFHSFFPFEYLNIKIRSGLFISSKSVVWYVWFFFFVVVVGAINLRSIPQTKSLNRGVGGGYRKNNFCNAKMYFDNVYRLLSFRTVVDNKLCSSQLWFHQFCTRNHQTWKCVHFLSCTMRVYLAAHYIWSEVRAIFPFVCKFRKPKCNIFDDFVLPFLR